MQNNTQNGQMLQINKFLPENCTKLKQVQLKFVFAKKK